MSGWLIGAVVLGLSAGLSPGPMLALVLSESLRHGFAAGARIAMAPLLTDGPILLLVALPFWLMADPGWLLAALGLMGGMYLLWLGVEALRTRRVELAPAPALAAGALRRGVLANFLNPNPYLFWLGIGLPSVIRLAEDSRAAALGFVLVFYAGLLGSKMLLAWLVARGRGWFRPALHLWTLRLLGLALLGYAVSFLYQGVIRLAAAASPGLRIGGIGI